jgi:hypothetical protein
MGLEKATPSIEGYEPPQVWDIGELVDLTEGKSGPDADGICTQEHHGGFS